MTEGVRAALAEHPFLAGLDPRHLPALAACASQVRFDPGDFLFREGEPADKAYLLSRGRVLLETSVPGRAAVIVDTVSDAEVVGWSWLFPPYRAHLDARAAGQLRAVSLDAVCLRSQCEADPVLGYELMRRFAAVFVRRLESMRQRLLELDGPHGRR